MAIESRNPATGELDESFEAYSLARVDKAIDGSEAAFAAWRLISFSERAEHLAALAGRFEAERDTLAAMAVREMGKRIAEARAEVDKCAWVCRHYAEEGERYLADEPAESDAAETYVAYQPLGPLLAVMPWNFPFWQVMRFAAPAAMAGNSILLKHASNVPQCALAVERLFREAGFPPDLFQTLLIGPDKVAPIIEDRRIRGVTLTGSASVGSKIGATAGGALKKNVLELGGSDPFIVMPSADLERAVDTALKARMVNNGQSCIAAKRFIVHSDVYDEVRDRFVRQADSMVVGDPMDEATDLGPLATAGIRDGLAKQVEHSVSVGARLATGGAIPNRPGCFYPPTVLEEIPDEAAATCEELFGPVASFYRVPSIDEAIRRANITTYGLGSSAWTRDRQEQQRFVRELEAGAVFINRMVASDPRIPFGGVKDSGYGRELSHHGIHEFVNVKTVAIDA
ncbi:MAG TPA: NAD-dependent succinate-semialdehyde dehydrogenase [Afifellaceae bacterium]|nr:NAD-dependent succinate-semialdehyde dehydrogenase [Afifellaceae bacterium]